MNNDERLLQEILQQTHELVELAEYAKWDALSALENQRDEQIRRLFDHTPEIEQETLREATEYLLEKNKLVMRYALSERDSLFIEQSKLKQSAKAVSAYLNEL